MSKKLRKMNDIMCDLEKPLQELTDPNGHDLQWYEVLYLVFGWLCVHAPWGREKYVNSGGSPVFYGPKEDK